MARDTGGKGKVTCSSVTPNEARLAREIERMLAERAAEK